MIAVYARLKRFRTNAGLWRVLRAGLVATTVVAVGAGGFFFGRFDLAIGGACGLVLPYGYRAALVRDVHTSWDENSR